MNNANNVDFYKEKNTLSEFRMNNQDQKSDENTEEED